MDQMVLATQTWLNTTYNGVNGYTPFSEEELDGSPEIRPIRG